MRVRPPDHYVGGVLVGLEHYDLAVVELEYPFPGVVPPRPGLREFGVPCEVAEESLVYVPLLPGHRVFIGAGRYLVFAG